MPASVPVSRRTALRLLGGAIAVVSATAATASPAGAADARRVNQLLAQLTLDEKLTFLHGATDPAPLGQAGYIPGVPRLGIPPLRLSDGPAGVRVTAHATALPAPALLASAFDPALAREYGRVIGREGRALGQDVLLSPMVNLIRTPYAGRNFETFSEDPLLASDMVAAEVGGIQSEGLIATVKHFAMNNQEYQRQSIDVVVDEQTMHETELRGFEAAIEAGAGAVMGAYNKVNGTFACENPYLLTTVLREQWGFGGWVMTDWFAAHSTAAAIRAGLDMEMPDGAYFGDALKKAVTDGTVPEALVDRSVRRILNVMDRFGLLAPGGIPPRPARDAAAGARTALKVATRGGVLLRNEREALPLTGAAARSVAVIGPTGTVPFVSGGGSAHVVPDAAASPLDAIRVRAGKVTYALGEDIYGRVFFEHTIPAGSPVGYSHDIEVTVPQDDEWTFLVHYTAAHPDRPKVSLDGGAELFPQAAGYGEYFSGGLISATPDGLSVRRKTVALTAGTHKLTVTATAAQTFRLARITSASRAEDVATAVNAARHARAAVVFAYEDATEGLDRTTIGLPGHQDALIAAVAAANPRTVVVLNTSSCSAMPWLAHTAAVLQMYYPGQEGAAATAALLFGEANPGGRLSQTFPVSDDRHPVAGDPHRYPGVDGEERYSEGVDIGYRWYEARKVRPLFPFGHGLSYTRFSYSRLTAEPDGRHGLRVTFTVRNTGRRTGDDVPQIYVGPSPDLALPQPPVALAAYRRLTLAPGQARTVTLRVPARVLSSWDPAAHGWVLGTGRRTVHLGASAGDLRLSRTAEVH
ncbi:beta-glucosidase family protein [Streptomyces sp. NBC_01262]|uniref:beta-glucosidase family protein n=1 Tax=Streptomyces sp. NBC_01262 TaxID=2903803 RepID=UPI002E3701F3|nr:glycoside hydrolase family 3 C-terminal domain-containing protein [Streptomyces sp. NBC_01262]